QDILNELFRVAHSIKGNSATMGFSEMSKLAHSMENVLDKLRSGELSVSDKIIDLMFKSLDILEEMLELISTDSKEESIDITYIQNELESIIAEPSSTSPTPTQPTPLYHTPYSLKDFELTDYEIDKIEQAEQNGFKVFYIITHFADDCALKSVRAFMVSNKLKEYGEILKSIPKEEDLDTKLNTQFKVVLCTRDSEEAIKNAITKISEIESVSISKYTPSKQSERPAKRCGAMTFTEATKWGDNGGGNGRGAKQPEEWLGEQMATVEERPVHQDNSKKEIKKSKIQNLRVNIKQLDEIMNLVGELAINKSNLEHIASMYDLKELTNVLSHFNRLINDLQNCVLEMRMVPIDYVFNKFPRMVRDLSKAEGKEIDFIIDGKDIELDRTVLDRISDPLVHLLRNAVDHGIETPEERESKGKSRTGTIKLTAKRVQNKVIIEIEDDGRGIDLQKIKASSIEKGIITEYEAKNLNDQELIALLFTPGVSTAKKVTDVSGRGVGLDVVKSGIESLGGTVKIESNIGIGSKFTLKLPLTVAIVQSLLVGVGKETYMLPLNNVLKTLKIN
ncbi:MAG: ATP-binding protein, partial [Methanosarcinales archaeon]